MCFKTPVCKVMCLVITVMLHSVTAELDALSSEALMDHMFEKFEHKLMEKLQAQNREWFEKQAASVENLERSVNNIIAVQLELQKQMSNMMKENSCRQEKLIEKLDAHATNVEQMMIESIQRGNQSNSDVIPTSCATLNNNATGTYYIQPVEAAEPFLVRCDFDDNFKLGGGWTVFQQRYDGSVDFYRNWTMYKYGFGDVNAEHWLGLEKLHLMTKSGKHELLIILGDFDGNTAYAHYKEFKISSEDEKYELTVGNYSGTAGDSLEWHNGMKFSTFDQDNGAVKENCSAYFHGAWWFRRCLYSHLNGRYVRKGELIIKYGDGVKWIYWKDRFDSLKSTKMMLRPRSGY